MVSEENVLTDENNETDKYYQICELIDEISYKNPSVDKEKFSKLKSYYQGDNRSIIEIKKEIDDYLEELDEKEEDMEFGPPEKEEEKEHETPQENEENSKDSEEEHTAENNEEEISEEYENSKTKEDDFETSSDTEANNDLEESEIYEGLDIYQKPVQKGNDSNTAGISDELDIYQTSVQKDNSSQKTEIYEGLLDAYQIPRMEDISVEPDHSSELGDMFDSYESFSNSNETKEYSSAGLEQPKQLVKNMDQNSKEGGYTDVVAMSMLTTAAVFSIITIILAMAVIM